MPRAGISRRDRRLAVETDVATTRPMIKVIDVTFEATDGVTVYQNDDETVIADRQEFWGACQLAL